MRNTLELKLGPHHQKPENTAQNPATFFQAVREHDGRSEKANTTAHKHGAQTTPSSANSEKAPRCFGCKI